MKRGEGKSFGLDADERIREGLRTLLRQNEDNQTRLAAKLGISQPAVSAILSGKNNASAAVAQKIAQKLGVTLDQLTGGRMTDERPAWSSLPWWDTVLERSRALFPQVSDAAWQWLGSLGGAEPPGADPWALGTIAATWDQAAARARADVDDTNKTRVRRKSGSK